MRPTRFMPYAPAVVLLIIALLFTACAPAAPAAPTTADQPAPTATAAGSDDQKLTTAAQQAAQGTAAQGGITITSAEEVSSPRSQLGGEYHDVATSDAVSFHQYQVLDTTSAFYQSLVFTGGLLRRDEKTLELIPNMAESYTISDDGLTFTFKLRQSMLWSDGEPITAQDFAWTFEQAMKPENGFPYLADYEFIESYVALDDYTIQAKAKQVHAPGLEVISGISPVPKHIWETLDWNDPEKNPEINSPTVVSGPYKLVEWKRDQHAIFEANDKYWYHGAPNLTRYVVEIVPDEDVAYEKFKSGEADTATIQPEKLAEARTLENVTIYEWWPAGGSWSYIGLNNRAGHATQDVNVRRGLAYAIDKDLITEQAMLGMARRQCSIYPATAWVFNENVECYNYDKDKALALLAEAGYTYDGTQLVNAEGQPLTLKLIYGPNTDSTLELIAVAVQDYLSQIGIQVEIQAMEWATFLEALSAEESAWDLNITSWSASIEPHFMCTLFSEANIPDLNAEAYINKKVEELCAQGAATFDTEQRKAIYQEVQQIIAAEAPYIFLYYQKAWSGQNKRIQGIEPQTLGIGWNRSDWYVTK